MADCEKALGDALEWRLWVGKQSGKPLIRSRSHTDLSLVPSLCAASSRTIGRSRTFSSLGTERSNAQTFHTALDPPKLDPYQEWLILNQSRLEAEEEEEEGSTPMAVERMSVAPMSDVFTPAAPPLVQSPAKQYGLRLCTHIPRSPSNVLKDPDDRPPSSASSTMNHPPLLQPGPRPIGPRSMDRSGSPASTLQLPPTAPLNIRKASQPQQTNGNGIQTSSPSNPSASFLSPARQQVGGSPRHPYLVLKIPTPPSQQKPGKLRLDVSSKFTNVGSESMGRSLGVTTEVLPFNPPLFLQKAQMRQLLDQTAQTQTMDDLRATVRRLDINPTPPSKLSSLSSTSIHQVLSNSNQGDEWSDEPQDI